MIFIITYCLLSNSGFNITQNLQSSRRGDVTHQPVATFTSFVPRSRASHRLLVVVDYFAHFVELKSQSSTPKLCLSRAAIRATRFVDLNIDRMKNSSTILFQRARLTPRLGVQHGGCVYASRRKCERAKCRDRARSSRAYSIAFASVTWRSSGLKRKYARIEYRGIQEEWCCEKVPKNADYGECQVFKYNSVDRQFVEINAVFLPSDTN